MAEPLSLRSFFGKKVTIIDENGNVFFGTVDDYFYPEDNDDGEESIVLSISDSEPIEFRRASIEKIYMEAEK